jgi:hypothetical protein
MKKMKIKNAKGSVSPNEVAVIWNKKEVTFHS